MGFRYLLDLPEGFFRADAAFFAFFAGTDTDTLTWGGAAMLTGSGSAGVSFGW